MDLIHNQTELQLHQKSSVDGRGNYFYVLCDMFVNLNYALPESIFYWKVCYIYFLGRSDSYNTLELYLWLYWYVCASYNGVWFYMFVYVILSNCWLYFILCILYYISPMYGLLFHCIVVKFVFALICLWMLCLCLIQYVGVVHMIFPLVVLHLGKLVIRIYCTLFVIILFPSSLTCIHKSGLTSLCLN